MKDFCAFIITHGRPLNILTLRSLHVAGYSGKYFFVVDDKDPELKKYQELYGDKVLVFSKEEIASEIELMDNLPNQGVIVYARNACFKFAKELGYKYFVQLDDDYRNWELRRDTTWEYICVDLKKHLDTLFELVLEYFKSSPFQTIALSQGGDHIGGKFGGGNIKGAALKRKAMNSFFCSTERPFKFWGRMNEDVNAYTSDQRTGKPFGTIMAAQLVQVTTQSSEGGMTGAYKSNGTYAKSFYSVIACPSAVKISVLGDPSKNAHFRVHHRVEFDGVAPKFLRQDLKKGRGQFDPYGPTRIEEDNG